MKPPEAVNRRDFLSLLGKGLLGLSGLLSFLGLGRLLSYQPDPPPQTRFDLGPASQYPPGSRTLIAAAQAVLIASDAGFSALSLVCPHLGCALESQGAEFACPCHGSRFAGDGGLLNGPASQPMRSLQVELAPDGHLILDTSA